MDDRRLPLHWSAGLVLSIGAILLLAFMADGRAMQGGNAATRASAVFPLAERTSPGNTLTPRQDFWMNQVADLYNNGQRVKAMAAADKILANDANTDFMKAKAARIAAQAAFETGKADAAIAYYQQAISLDALDNDMHFGAMRNLGVLLLEQRRFADSVATYDRLFAETRARSPSDLIVQGQALYSMGRYPQAVPVIEEAIAGHAGPNPKWQELLTRAHMKAGEFAQALRLAQQVAAGSPTGRQIQMNLAYAYQQNAMPQEAAAVLEAMRSRGQLHTAADYQQLSSIYTNLDGHERQAIDVINEGLEAGALKPDFTTLETLAKLYYLAGQKALAIDAYAKAAPLDDDGATYLDVATLLVEENRIAEAQVAARHALDKGLEGARGVQGARDILAVSKVDALKAETLCQGCNL